MTTTEDLAVIDAYMREAAVRAVAEAVRAQQSQLAIPALSAPVNIPAAPRVVTVTPVPFKLASEPTGWWRYHWPHVLIATAAATFLGLLTWGVVRLVSAVTTAASHAIPVLLPIALVVLLALLLCGGRGGGGSSKSFSGTFEGRMH